MDVQAFWQHWNVREDPFRAEEARGDAVFQRLMGADAAHPDFEKMFGQLDRPASAVVFGDKGSGKTALRLLMEQTIADHNSRHSDEKIWPVRYDDLNPILDRFTAGMGQGSDGRLLDHVRLEDHMDAMLSLVITEMVDEVVEERRPRRLPSDAAKRIRRMPRARRVDLALLAVLYDQPSSGSMLQRWRLLRKVLRLGRPPLVAVAKGTATVFGLTALALWIAQQVAPAAGNVIPYGIGGSLVLALLSLVGWGWERLQLGGLARKIRREVRFVQHRPGELLHALARLRRGDLTAQPLPTPGDQDSRYQLTVRLLRILEQFGYIGVIVLVDRVDEPTLVNGDPVKMKALVWPLLNNKFLQQEGLGVKLLLPIELRHMLQQESAEFFQRARLDKQHMIDRLSWSGAMLYDLCSRRLQACRPEDAPPITLADLFDDDVSQTELVDALDQMGQPRDACRFLYQVVREHCGAVPQDAPAWRIPRLILQQVRKQHSQRVQDFSRGFTPA